MADGGHALPSNLGWQATGLSSIIKEFRLPSELESLGVDWGQQASNFSVGISLENCGSWVQISALLFTGCVALGKSSNLPGSQFSHLKRRIIIVPTSEGYCKHKYVCVCVRVC